MQKVSLHFGLNIVDEAIYLKKYPPLINSVNDAVFYKTIAEGKGFATSLYADANATKTKFADELIAKSKLLNDGDFLLITYSGHGTYVKDLDGDEPDMRDEAFVFYDGILIDDVIKQYWPKFKQGVRILLITDSCYNATVTRFRLFGFTEVKKSKGIKLHPEFMKLYLEDKPDDNDEKEEINCSIIHMASSSDGGQSYGGNTTTKLSTYTYCLSQLLKVKGYQMTCKEIQDNLKIELDGTQKPQYEFLGKPNPEFEGSRFLQ